jgi:hypothetical protein
VRDVTITEQLPLPYGAIYAMTARHAKGTSYWELGISTLTNRIEYASFRADTGGLNRPAPDEDDDLPPVRTKPRPTPEPDSGGKTTTDGCKRWPNLCP